MMLCPNDQTTKKTSLQLQQSRQQVKRAYCSNIYTVPDLLGLQMCFDILQLLNNPFVYIKHQLLFHPMFGHNILAQDNSEINVKVNVSQCVAQWQCQSLSCQSSAVYSGCARGARVPQEFGGSEKGRSLISAYRSLAITMNTPRFKNYLRRCIVTNLRMIGCMYMAKTELLYPQNVGAQVAMDFT